MPVRRRSLRPYRAPYRTERDAALAEQKSRMERWFQDQDGRFVVAKRGLPERFKIASQDGVLNTIEGPAPYAPGYFIMTGVGGEQWAVEPTEFHKKKDIMSDGVALPKVIPIFAKIPDESGKVLTSWGADLEYRGGGDEIIVRYGPGDYGVVQEGIFANTYDVLE